MHPWQLELTDDLRVRLPTATVEPYGSAADPSALDAWSDLDVTLTSREPFGLEAALGAPLWAFQEAFDADTQVVRTVLVDGRRVDLAIHGVPGRLPVAPADNAIRFDAALAAARFGRGNDLIGLHLTLGILREALVCSMVMADRAAGQSHHRFATAYDERAASCAGLLRGPLGPGTAASAYDLYGAWRAEIDPGYRPAPDGLRALIARAA